MTPSKRVPELARQRLATARDLTKDMDSKAQALAGLVGLLWTGGSVVAATVRPAGIAVVLAGAAGLALVVALLALLAVVRVRGGSPLVWLLELPDDPNVELTRVARIAGRKAQWLHVAGWALAGACGLGAAAALALVVTQ